MPLVPLFGTATRGKSRFVTSEERTNLYVEKTVDGDKYETAYFSRPGLTRLIPSDLNSDGVGKPLGICKMTLPGIVGGGFIGPEAERLWIAREGGWDLWSSTVNNDMRGNSIGPGIAVPGTNFVSMAYVGLAGGTATGFAVDGRFAWWIFAGSLASPPLDTIATGGFPWVGSRSVTFLAQRLIVDCPEFPGRFAWSPLLPAVAAVWSALDFANAESSPDALVCVKTFRGELILFGTQTIEFWAPSEITTFANIQGSTAPWGLVTQQSIGIVGDHLFFLAKSGNGKAQVCVLDGYQPKVISTPDIEYLINSDLSPGVITANAFSTNGHEFYELNMADVSLVFDMTTQSWAPYWKTDGGRWAGQFVAEAFGELIVADYRDLRTYKLNPNEYRDDGGPHFIREVTGRHVFSDIERITLNEIILDVETGEGPPIFEPNPADPGGEPLQRAPQVMMQLSKDGGRTFGFELWESIGKIGMYRTLVEWTRLGRARDLVFKFRVSDPVKVTFQGASARISTRGGQGGD